MSAEGTACPTLGLLIDANDGLEERGGVGYVRIGGVPAGVGPKDRVASATAGDCKGDEVGKSLLRLFTSSGGSNGVVAYRSRSTSSGSISIALALPTSMAMGVGKSSLDCSRLTKVGVEVGGMDSSGRSMVETW